MYKIIIDGKTYYACGECNLIYERRRTASECETWCRNHKTCNIDIARNAVGSIVRIDLRLANA